MEEQDLDYIALEDKYSLSTYTKRPLLIVKGEGAVLYDEHNQEYIDAVSGSN